jgi:hypothetical protein
MLPPQTHDEPEFDTGQQDFTPPPAPPTPAQPETMDVVLAAFAALGYALSARALLFLSLVGAFVLGVFAMAGTSWLRLVTLLVYGLLTVIPTAWLEYRRREG